MKSHPIAARQSPCSSPRTVARTMDKHPIASASFTGQFMEPAVQVRSDGCRQCRGIDRAVIGNQDARSRTAGGIVPGRRREIGHAGRKIMLALQYQMVGRRMRSSEGGAQDAEVGLDAFLALAAGAHQCRAQFRPDVEWLAVIDIGGEPAAAQGKREASIDDMVVK